MFTPPFLSTKIAICKPRRFTRFALLCQQAVCSYLPLVSFDSPAAAVAVARSIALAGTGEYNTRRKFIN